MVMALVPLLIVEFEVMIVVSTIPICQTCCASCFECATVGKTSRKSRVSWAWWGMSAGVILVATVVIAGMVPVPVAVAVD